MTRDEVYTRVFASPLFRQWHWFRYHFERKLRGGEEPFAESIVDACLDCEAAMAGYAARTIDALTSIGGREKDRRDYEQLLQLLAELLVVRQLVTWAWPHIVAFAFDPVPLAGGKNPELTIATPNNLIGVEVKAPALLEHERLRETRDLQAPSRALPLDKTKALAGGADNLTLPRDNPLKDFLMSAEAKFAPFKAERDDFVGALVIVWDDFIYEPITALEHPSSGLFTMNSFARDKDGDPLRFPSVDGVVLVRHLHQFKRAAAEQPLADEARHALDYGRGDVFPPKAYVPNPDAAGLPPDLLAALQAEHYRDLPGAEHAPNDLVFWLPVAG